MSPYTSPPKPPDDGPRPQPKLHHLDGRDLARYLRSAVNNQDEVHDLVQETFVKLVASPPPARPQTPQAYLLGVARHVLWRRRNRAPLWAKAVHVPIDEANDLAVAPEQEWMIDAADFMRRYETALAELPELTREVFRLSRQEDLTYSQISERLGITVRAVELQMLKAIRYLDHRVNSDD
ncbi:RNA polymerase sigma factor [Sphingopyxis macrogoltabida]|uniref:RNA polymerase sigma factor n=1 Tax=Sphingopyxis macrogoltabida TaxID=33050 RepID=UPI0009E75B60|nr:sigma-70 family RNA polymerase sigma factor [Sphingopyxis macrogoltabida]